VITTLTPSAASCSARATASLESEKGTSREDSTYPSCSSAATLPRSIERPISSCATSYGKTYAADSGRWHTPTAHTVPPGQPEVSPQRTAHTPSMQLEAWH
jgi:hypothetical protein